MINPNLKNPLSSLGSKLPKLIILVAILIFILPLTTRLNPFFSVEYGTLGVVARFGKIERLANPGLNLKLPFFEDVKYYSTQKIIYETSEQPDQSPFYVNSPARKAVPSNSAEQKIYSDSADYPVDTTTKDGQQVSIRYTLRYTLDPTKILWIAQNVGSQDNVATRIVQAESRSVVRNVAREFPASELYTGDVFNYQIKVAERLKDGFEKNGVVLDEFLVRQVKFSPDYLAAIEQKQVEQEKVKIEEFKAQQEQFIKQQKIIRAEGEAEAQAILKQTIDALLLQKQAIEKWNGVLPAYYGSSNPLPFVQLK